jgi:ABC-2 type transport system ATP-binding protein
VETAKRDIAIRTQNLTRDFAKIRAVDGIALEVSAGSVFGFLGPNGAGKTTTIRLLLGLIESSDGTAEVLGFDTRTQGYEIRRNAGALFENSGLYERLTAAENLEFYARAWQMQRGTRETRVRELLSQLGLWDRRDEAVATWSRGMKQKLAIARTMLHRPALIFLDEPTAGLDPVAAAALRDELLALASREGVTVFLTTHNLAEAEKLCAQVAVIRQGKLLAVGSPDELRTREGGQKAEIVGRGFSDQLLAKLRQRAEVEQAEVMNGRLSLSLKGDVEIAPLVSLVVIEGAEVEEVRRDKASLEDVFLTLMEEEKQ